MSQLDDLDRAWIAKINRLLDDIELVGKNGVWAMTGDKLGFFKSGALEGIRFTVKHIREGIEK